MWQVEGTGSVQYNLVSVSPWWSSTLSSISDSLFLLNKGLNQKKQNNFMLLCPQFVSVFISFIFFSFIFFPYLRSKTTCLMLAAREGYTKVINLLVSHGAELDSQDGMGFTVSHKVQAPPFHSS